MIDKTTEEAAEEHAKESIQSILTTDRAFLNEVKYNSFIAGADSLSTTIAQLREENERYQWVSVEDRLPENENDILICRQDGFEDWQSIGNCIDGKYYNVWDLECECFPTHWRPLPAPPTEALTPKPPKTNK